MEVGETGVGETGIPLFLYVLRSAKTSFLLYMLVALVTLASLKTFKARFIANSSSCTAA